MRIVASRSGLPTVKVGDRLLHSAYDPMREAQREVEAIAAGDPALVVILGMGLGYSIDAVLEQLPKARVLVVEVNPAMFGLASDVRKLPDDSRVTYVLGRNDEANFIAITHAIGPSQASSIRYLSRLADLEPAYYTEIVSLIGRVAAMHIEGMKTTAAFGLLWWTNSVLNYRQWLERPDVAGWFGSRRGEPVFIFAAGPSMMDDLELFDDREGGIRFAVDTAYPTLCELGIRIDAVFAIDAQDATLEHFKDFAPGRLVAAPVVPPRLWSLAGESVITSISGPHFAWFDSVLGRDVAKLKSGGSVTTFAFDLARRMGADPIVLMGADFAYRDHRRYVAGTAYEKQSTAALTRFRTIEQMDNEALLNSGRRNDLATDENLAQYAQWMEWEVKETITRTFRMTDFGLLKSVPVIGRGLLEELLRVKRPSLPDLEPPRSNPDSLMRALRNELGELDRAIADPAMLPRLSGFFDPIVRPYAVVSVREALEGEILDRMLDELGKARGILRQVLA